MNTLANELISNNHDVTQIVLNNSTQDTVKNLASIIEVKREWKAGIFSTLYRFCKFNFYLLQLRPKILILNCELAELYGAFSLYTGEIVAVEHTNKPWIGRKKIGYLVRWILRARKVNWIKVSSFLQIWPYKNVPAMTIENPVIQIERRSSKENERINQLVYVGRFTPQKRTELLPFIAKLSNKKLVLLGDGESLGAVLKACHENFVEVESHGFVRDPWRLIPANSLLLVPTSGEGDGLVVIEAVLGNIPFLLSDIPEFRRFGFSDRNYCFEIDDFVKTITEYDGSLRSLEISASKASALENSRNPILISKLWVNFLESII